MLLIGTGLEIAGLTIYPDHVSRTTFHYLPGSPRLVSVPGRPGAQLLRYRGSAAAGAAGAGAGGTGAAGGGLLTLDIHLAVDPQALLEARRQLAARAGADVSLVPVTFNEGRVRLAALGVETQPVSDAQPNPRSFLVEQVIASAVPSLFGDARAVFSVALPAEGATLIDAALRSRSLPVIVAYELAFEGLRLARGLRAKVQYRMAYDFLRARAAANALLFKADVDREAEALRREQLITIEDVDYTGDDPATLVERADEIRTTLQELAQTLFFRPAASPAALPPQVLAAQPAIEQQWSGAARAQAAFVLRDLVQHEEAELTYDLTATRVARRTIVPQGALAALDGFVPDEAIRDIDLTEPRPREIRAVVPAGADWSGVGAIEILLQPADGSAAVSDAVRPDRTDVSIPMPPGDLSARTRVLVKPDPEALGGTLGLPGDILSDLAPLAADTLVLDPAALAERHPLTLSLTAIDAASRISARGSLDRGPASRPFVLDAARPSITVPVWGTEPVRLSVAVAIDGDVAYTDTRDLGAGERLVAINPPGNRVQLVVIELVDPLARFESVFVEIEALPDGSRRQVRLDSSAPRQEWTAIAATGGARRYRYQVRKVFKDARSLDQPWQEGAGQLLLVGDTSLRLTPVDIILLGMPADAIAAELTVTSLTPPADVPAAASLLIEQTLLAEQGGRATVRVASAAGAALRYRVEGRVFTETGQELTIGPLDDGGEVCLVPVGA